jgi:hypothetical protein
LRTAPPVAFLGVCDRAGKVVDDSTGLTMWNAIGIKSVVGAHIFPLPLSGWSFLFALYNPEDGEQFDLVVRDPAGNEVGSAHLSLTGPQHGDRQAVALPERQEYAVRPTNGWMVNAAAGESVGFLAPTPGLYTFYLRTDDGERTEVPIGSLHLGLLEPEPLTPARIAAIKSDPESAKIVRVNVACSACADKISAYSAFERSYPFGLTRR